MKHSSPRPLGRPRQAGATLIEVLVAILILSFGMLSLGGMLAYAVQMPKFAAFRATASIIAASHVERMRANPAAFAAGSYNEAMTYKTSPTLGTGCVYPACTASDIASADKDELYKAVKQDLPGLAGVRIVCNGPCADRSGDIWVMWDEPTTFASLNAANSDECPTSTPSAPFAFTVPLPRCVHVRFQL
jgi:type IV pilus assembly protein PilV